MGNNYLLQNQMEIKNLNPLQQTELLLLTLKIGEMDTVIFFTKKFEEYYKTYNISENIATDNTFGNKKLIKLILSKLKTTDDFIIPSLLNLIKITCQDDNNRLLVKNKGGIEIILQLMKRYLTCDIVQDRACGVLRNLTLNNGIGMLIVLQGGIELTMQAIKIHPNHTGIQENAFGVLKNLAWADHNTDLIINNGGVKIIIQTMKLHFTHAGIQEQTLSALTLYVSSLTLYEEIRLSIEKEGGIELIVQIMKFHYNHAKIQEYSCVLLWIFASNNRRKNKILIRNKGGIELTFRAIKLHPNNIEIQEWGIGVLKLLAEIEENQKLIQKMGFWS